MTQHIQIGDVSPRIQYTADGAQTVFTYPFPIFQAADMAVYLDETGLETGFTVNGAGDSSGGNVTFDSPPTDGTTVTLRRNLAIQRTTDFQEGGEFRAKVINDELDYQTAALQQVEESQKRSIRFSETHAGSSDPTMPAPEADKVAAVWNDTADALVIGPTVSEISNAQTYATNAAASASAASTSETNAGTSETNAAASASAASTSETNAGTSATNAAASAAAADVAKIEWQGAWSGATAYALNDAVSEGGASYICTTAHTNQQPPNATYWDLLAERGLDGEGAGDVLGPASATADSLARFSGTTGKLLKDGAVIGTDVHAHMATASQAEMEAGTEAALRAMSPQRVSQAIAALAGGGVPIGATIDWAGSGFPSTGIWLVCDGSNISRTSYASLFAAIGTAWGVGDGSTTFSLPDLRGRVTVGSGTGSGLTARTLADTGGEEDHSLTSGENGPHTHSFPKPHGAGSSSSAGFNGTDFGNNNYGTPSVNSSGSGTAHENMPPFAVVRKLIKAGD